MRRGAEAGNWNNALSWWWVTTVVMGVMGWTVVSSVAWPLEARAVSGEVRPLVAALHVHSTASTGMLSIESLAERAERLGLDAVVLSDNFILNYEYGLPPLPGVIRRTYELPSVLRYGLQRYLDEIAAVQERHPNVLLVPGVEVAAHYYWTGSLWDRNLTMHNAQRNLLVLGLRRAEDYAALPVLGNHASYRYGWGTLFNLAPSLLSVPALWLWRAQSSTRSPGDRTASRRGTGRRVPAVALVVIAGLLLANAWPWSEPTFSPYDSQLGYRPYQAVIDAANARGGAALWSMTEARDSHTYSFGRVGNVTVKTDPHPEALVLTTDYIGFGGVYQETRQATAPAGTWDQLLHLSVTGQRTHAPVAVGEIAFHGPDYAGKELDHVVTVLWARERTIAGVLEALRQGRAYAVAPAKREVRLVLDDFGVSCQAGAKRAATGDTLDPEGARDLVVHVALTASDRGHHPITVRIIRSGQVVARVTGETPFVYEFPDTSAPAGEWMSYRMDASGASGELLSNPVFVGPIPAAGAAERQQEKV